MKGEDMEFGCNFDTQMASLAFIVNRMSCERLEERAWSSSLDSANAVNTLYPYRPSIFHSLSVV